MKEALVKRLQLVMEHRELSTSGLADALGVQRSSISHILNGRNKPSLDFVMKVVHTFPEVRLDWFLKGEGDFPNSPTPSSKPQDIRNTPSANSNTQKQKGYSPSRKLIKTILFYDDGSLEVFEPKN